MAQFALTGVVAFVLLAAMSLPGRTQAMPSADQLLQLQQRGQGQATLNSLQSAPQPDIILQPVVTGDAKTLSTLEKLMSERAGADLKQFGYNLLGVGHTVTLPQVGAIQDDYVLGPGDEVVVSLRGQENNEFRAYVDRNGQIILPRLNPIAASGRSFGSFREDIQAAVHRAYVATDAFVSIGRVRQITVLVTGEVNAPGQRILTGLSSAADAILISGGVKKTGSLRNVRIFRAGHAYTLDLYSYLTNQGNPSTFRLADGDRIMVPSIGTTVAIAGLVKQPAIYELPGRQSGISVRALIALAGGTEMRGTYRLSVLRVLADGRTGLVALTNENETVRGSEVLMVQATADQTISQAQLSGKTGLAGSFPITSGTKLSDVLRSPGAIGQKPYTLFGMISRRDPRTLLMTLIAFTPLAVLDGSEDMQLQANDNVRVISVSEEKALTAAVSAYKLRQAAEQELLHNPISGIANERGGPSDADAKLIANGAKTISGRNPATNDVPGTNTAPDNADNHGATSNVGTPNDNLDSNATDNGNNTANSNGNNEATPGADTASTLNQTSRVAAAMSEGRSLQSSVQNKRVDATQDVANSLGVDPLVMMNFLVDHQAKMDGGVRGPGTYLIGPHVNLLDMVMAAGGTDDWTDESSVELISTSVDPQTGRSQTRRVQLPLRQGALASYIVRPQDEFRFRQIYTDIDVGNVTVQGEVRFPGSFHITRGEHLSDLLGRAGGLTSTAYPYGTVFLRKSAAVLERDGYIRTAKEAEDQLIIAMTRVGTDKISPDTFTALQHFVADLRTQRALGRVSIQADPSVLAAKPELDPLLESGDVIYIPQRPSTVSVLGQVLQAGSFPYKAGESAEDYLAHAGGVAQFADDSQIFIVLPDGTARRLDHSWLDFDAENLPPGSAIVVPRDLTPLDLRQTIIDVSQIFSQLAISVASLVVLSRQ